MIKLKNNEQLEIMKIAGRITGEALYLAGEAVKEGVKVIKDAFTGAVDTLSKKK